MTEAADISTEKIWLLLQEVTDPEVPVLSVTDLGIIRQVMVQEDGTVELVITPTYSGCPAMDMIRTNIRLALLEQGFKKVNITTVLSPAWTTDWMSEAGKEKLKAYGIAPPTARQSVCHPNLFQREEAISCPRCNSYNTHMISEFGSTACKALYRCEECREPFDYFKCH
ncbi:MAG TPA: 1,2-phenylacetyl-CoA epoxidase subunit PaaD [Puia sp.]|nr:1,2-phenylacetyl-CoA epoxidase subunit PaaD [Puia sp.]